MDIKHIGRRNCVKVLIQNDITISWETKVSNFTSIKTSMLAYVHHMLVEQNFQHGNYTWMNPLKISIKFYQVEIDLESYELMSKRLNISS